MKILGRTNHGYGHAMGWFLPPVYLWLRWLTETTGRYSPVWNLLFKRFVRLSIDTMLHLHELKPCPFIIVLLFGYRCLLFLSIFLVLNLNKSGLSNSKPWLLITWIPASPGQQSPCYWLRRLNTSLSYTRKGLKYMCHCIVEKENSNIFHGSYFIVIINNNISNTRGNGCT